MKLQQYIEQVLQRLETSPLLKMGGFDELKHIQNDLNTLYDKVNQPLHIALIGEVKSGKSTLINAFAGGQVSPTDATETTACIMKLKYSPHETAVLYFTDGREKIGTPEEIFAILLNHKNEQNFFSTCDHVQICMPLKGLKHVQLVDTPGLATITSSNAMRTEAYFQSVDVVLWVFNGKYLGQADVNEELRKVANLGKPIVAVINRIDQINGDPQELVDYLDDTLGIYVDSIFPLSAKQAFDGIVEQNEDLVEKSGFTALYQYLDTNVERNADDVQEDSIRSSVKVLEGKIAVIHQQALNLIKEKLQTYLKLDDQIRNSGGLMQMEFVGSTQSWISHEFLHGFEEEMRARVNGMGPFNSNSGEFIKKQLSEGLTNDRIESEISEYLKKLQIKIQSEWQGRLTKIDSNLNHLYEDTMRNNEMEAQAFIDQLPEVEGGLESVKGSLVAAGTVGTALATYTAVLGPAAAHISIGTAIGAVMPPVLLAGAALGAVMGYAKNKKAKEQYYHMIDSVLFTVRRNVEAEMILRLKQGLETICEETCVQAKKDFVEKNFDGLSLEELETLVNKLEKTVEQLSIKELQA